MSFIQKFDQYAQAAILSKLDNGQWEDMPWLAKLVQQRITVGLTTEAHIEGVKPVLDARNLSDEHVELIITGQKDLSKPSEHVHVPYQFVEKAECSKAAGDKIQPSTPKENDYFVSTEFVHENGYDWQIVVISRDKDPHNSWAVHFPRLPTQEEFETQFKYFHLRTHFVHVNAWRHGVWVPITDLFNGKNLPTEQAKESFETTSDWEEGKNWRIKFWDERVGRMNYVYFDRKPAGITMAKYHSAKCHAVAEARPEGV